MSERACSLHILCVSDSRYSELFNVFNDYLEKISCMNGNIVIVGEFNIDWLNTERMRLYNILETFGFFKIYALKHTRVTIYLTILLQERTVILYQIAQSRDLISDHRVLHASLQCICHHSVRKQITVRALRRIKDDALAEDLDRFNVDHGCVNVDIMIEQYDKYLSDLLDRHAPKKNMCSILTKQSACRQK